jgi:zinc D-Ala-D-Ala dipeptidase
MNEKINNLVDVSSVIPDIEIDSKYATKDNFTKKIIYPIAKCYLIEEVARALNVASEDFNKLGYKIKVWDGYRPLKTQYIFWELVPDERYVANPRQGSRHNRGCAVDLTLIDKNGKELNMGTDFDDFTEKAHRDFQDFPSEILMNRQLLQNIMEKNHFVGWKNEWWHFDFEGWENYPILDIDFDEVEL